MSINFHFSPYVLSNYYIQAINISLQCDPITTSVSIKYVIHSALNWSYKSISLYLPHYIFMTFKENIHVFFLISLLKLAFKKI